MSSDRIFTHPGLGTEVRIEQYDREVHLVFVCGTREQSDGLCDDLLAQLKGGGLHLTLMGKPTSVTEVQP